MPSIANVVARFTNQTLVYWQKIGSDQYAKPIYADPVQINCRWEDKQQEIITPDGRKVLSHAYVLLIVPLVVGSLVYLGTLSDWLELQTYTSTPTVNQGGREVILLKTTPDLRATTNIYEVYL